MAIDGEGSCRQSRLQRTEFLYQFSQRHGKGKSQLHLAATGTDQNKRKIDFQRHGQCKAIERCICFPSRKHPQPKQHKSFQRRPAPYRSIQVATGEIHYWDAGLQQTDCFKRQGQPQTFAYGDLCQPSTPTAQ